MIFTASATMAAFACAVECFIDLAKNKSILMKIMGLLCLYSSYLFAQSGILIRNQVRNTTVGVDVWIRAGTLLGFARIGRLLVMTKFDVINSLIFSRSLQVHFQALMGLIGMMQLFTAINFRSYAEDYQYFYYAVGLNLFVSSLRIGAAFLMHRCYHPKKQYISNMESLNDSQDSI